MIFSSSVPRSVKKDTPVIAYLAARFTYYSAEKWKTRVREERIVRNGMALGVADTVSPGDILSYDAGEFEEPAADLTYRIIHEDPWLHGIDKPGNLLVHRAGTSFRNNLIYQLREVHDPSFPHAHCVHRLDRETSGVVLIVTSRGSIAPFARLFARGGLRKVYRAIVRGKPDTGEIDLPIGKASGSAISYKYRVDPAGKPACTTITDVRPLGGNLSLCTLVPHTGRTHQIRVHLAFMGAPILGDKLYGMSEQEYCAWRANPHGKTYNRMFPRQALHCESLTFMHPFTGRECRIESPLPEDMKSVADWGMRPSTEIRAGIVD
ncbi:MAG: RluA family pseudouridine synthase [Chitinispirillaceae bacterium]|nr:RluA family pseudouridine synthase [Chitinispirillaceae bacterium]